MVPPIPVDVAWPGGPVMPQSATAVTLTNGAMAFLHFLSQDPTRVGYKGTEELRAFSITLTTAQL